MSLSVGRTGSCHDNAIAESFFGTLKNEIYHRRKRRTRLEARNVVINLIERRYNRSRPHSTIGNRIPAEAMESFHVRTAQRLAAAGQSGGRQAPDRQARLSAGPLEEAAHQQPPGAHQQGDKAQVESRAGVPVRQAPGEAGQHRHVRAGRCLGRVEILLREKHGRALHRRARALSGQRKGPRGAGGGGREDDYGEPRPCRPSGRGLGQGQVLDFGDSTKSPHHGPVTPTFSTLPLFSSMAFFTSENER